MITPRSPLYLSHAPTPRVEHFAIIAALEAGFRGLLLSVMPLIAYRTWSDGQLISGVYLAVGIASLLCGLMVPWASRFVPRRWLFTAAGLFYLIAIVLALMGSPSAVAASLLVKAVGTVTFSVTLSAYVLDYIARQDLGRNESVRMLFSAASWTIGPAAGVLLLNWWTPAPFLLAGLFAVLMTGVFWYLRLGNGKQITRAAGPAANPLAYLGRFAQQPRLIAGWLFAVIRSCGWWVFIVYLPIFCIEEGLGDTVGGLAVSASNALLFSTPFMLRLVHRISVRAAVRGSFFLGGLFFLLAWPAAGWPWVVVGLMVAASVMLVMLDVAGSLPFLMAVKPSERTEMAAVYSSFRDVSGIVTPAVAGMVLAVAPVAAVFAACGGAMWIAYTVAGSLHPRLGRPRSPETAEAEEMNPP
jgi:ACDE family multidrug resistance protein